MSGIVYEKHPVSPERKAAVLAQGKRIIDARFAPKDVSEPAVPSKSEIATMKKADCMAHLESMGLGGIDGTVAELRDMLRQAVHEG